MEIKSTTKRINIDNLEDALVLEKLKHISSLLHYQHEIKNVFSWNEEEDTFNIWIPNSNYSDFIRLGRYIKKELFLSNVGSRAYELSKYYTTIERNSSI